MQAAAAKETLFTASGVEKSFGRTRALADASITLRRGEIHALLGANGAGKSTLSRVICGQIRPDAGDIAYRGKPFAIRRARDAIDAGISLVMQETSLAPDLSVVENIFLPELGRPGLPRFGEMRRKAEDILSRLGQRAQLPLDGDVRALSAAQRQLVEIAKALALESDLIIFDEPTASLSPGEVERLFDIMVKLRDEGRALAFVSHRLEEVFAVTDKVTVLREGRTVAADVATAKLTQTELIRHMVGRELSQIYLERAPSEQTQKPVVLEVENLKSAPLVRDVSFSLHRGEIVGLGGLVGAGRSETLEAIFGLRRRDGGAVRLNGKPFAPRKPAQSIRAGIGFVPEDRRRQSIVPDLSVRENLLLAHLGAHRGFGLAYRRRDEKVSELLAMLGLPADRLLDASMLNFSGGMQQKIIIARWLMLDPDVILLDEPTKGVDIGTRSSIYAMLRAIADRGVAVLIVSSDFDELLGICERVVVISDGMSIADMPSAVLDEEKLTLLAAPRTSMERNVRFLRDLAATYRGAAFWGLIEDEKLFCLKVAVADQRAAPGFGDGAAVDFAETRIPAALGAAKSQFVSEADGSLNTLIVDVAGSRGHAMGAAGLVLPHDTEPPDAGQLAAVIQAHYAAHD
ncbi:sugar ABC transporter ATP-binding protein [Mesorhizobium amorphae]|uniref:ABC transporter n=1 Tax=Mesorhizobium amorphae CCNWGS0123 TaxID=1082933 RepID=G6YIS6_9HYPH|nr:sugar ABC transporter ATP-binding protein [Mesorhizobium amorphae]ANT51179.1 ABC transporter [Mesorhizobium amorphae CCNWGS0123]EHH05881.1 ABC transporter [Mesorhizobium amorphae CCNWGS0123]GLR42623.1 putative ribose/galactose/methyl galactoside import ATP-binding protein 1 [Mesorhizobium amorphae]